MISLKHARAVRGLRSLLELPQLDALVRMELDQLLALQQAWADALALGHVAAPETLERLEKAAARVAIATQTRVHLIAGVPPSREQVRIANLLRDLAQLYVVGFVDVERSIVAKVLGDSATPEGGS